jgi:hypothetical protein
MTSAAPAVQDFSQFVGKKVDISYTKGTENVVESGVIRSANSHGVLFAKGAKTDLLLNHEIQDVVATATAPKAAGALKAKRVDPVTISGVRRHLAQAHGALLSDLNGSSNEALYKQHEAWHVEAGDNAPHFHAEKVATD